MYKTKTIKHLAEILGGKLPNFGWGKDFIDGTSIAKSVKDKY